MKPEDKVVSLKTARQLKEAGHHEDKITMVWRPSSTNFYLTLGSAGEHDLAAPDVQELLNDLGDLGNELAIGYNGSGCFWHVTVGPRGAGDMIQGIGRRFDGCGLEDDSLVEVLAHAWLELTK